MQLWFPPSATSHHYTFITVLQGHPGQLLCWDRGLHHLCSKRGKCAYALRQCTQQGEAHPIYLVTCSLFWVIRGELFSYDWASNWIDKNNDWLMWFLLSLERRCNCLWKSWMPFTNQWPQTPKWGCILYAWMAFFFLNKVLIFLFHKQEKVVTEDEEVWYFWDDTKSWLKFAHVDAKASCLAQYSVTEKGKGWS